MEPELTGTAETGKSDLNEIVGNKHGLDTVKPVLLLKYLTATFSDQDDLIVDFFAGSCTTAQAVFELNAEQSSNRKVLLVQIPELINQDSEAFAAGFKSIVDIGKRRLNGVSEKLRTSIENYDGDLGFKVFKLDSTNIKPWEVDFDMTERTLEDFISNIKTERREEDVLYEILLKYGLDLTLPITEHAIAGQKVFDIGMGALIICLSDAISLEVVEGIAKLKDELNPEIMRVVFKDSGFKDDVVKTNAVQILKQAGIVDVRSL
jgi:adenine-specific DNA-methyltransferase